MIVRLIQKLPLRWWTKILGKGDCYTLTADPFAVMVYLSDGPHKGMVTFSRRIIYYRWFLRRVMDISTIDFPKPIPVPESNDRRAGADWTDGVCSLPIWGIKNTSKIQELVKNHIAFDRGETN